MILHMPTCLASSFKFASSAVPPHLSGYSMWHLHALKAPHPHDGPRRVKGPVMDFINVVTLALRLEDEDAPAPPPPHHKLKPPPPHHKNKPPPPHKKTAGGRHLSQADGSYGYGGGPAPAPGLKVLIVRPQLPSGCAANTLVGGCDEAVGARACSHFGYGSLGVRISSQLWCWGAASSSFVFRCSDALVLNACSPRSMHRPGPGRSGRMPTACLPSSKPAHRERSAMTKAAPSWVLGLTLGDLSAWGATRIWRLLIAPLKWPCHRSPHVPFRLPGHGQRPDPLHTAPEHSGRVLR